MGTQWYRVEAFTVVWKIELKENLERESPEENLEREALGNENAKSKNSKRKEAYL